MRVKREFGQWEESRDGKAQFKIGPTHPPNRKLLSLGKILENLNNSCFLITAELLWKTGEVSFANREWMI